MEMELKIHSQNVRVTENLEEYARKKIGRLDRFLPNIADIWVELSHENTRSGEMTTAQITLRHKRGAILRAEEHLRGNDHETLHAAINLAVDKMYRRIQRFKGKRDPKGRERFTATLEEIDLAEELPEEVTETAEATAVSPYDEYEDAIVRRKQVAVTHMTELEAVEQMELLGHDFFMFHNKDTNGVNVLYRRKSGGYGVLVPQVEG
jgi:putative sigma-54 modulation protein